MDGLGGRGLPSAGYLVALPAATPNEFTLDGSGWSGSVAATAAGATMAGSALPIRTDKLNLVNVPFFLKFPGDSKLPSLS